jgi:hypothetical protein
MAIIGTLPNNIQNGQSVDANPVMADFNFIVNQVNANANPVGTLTAPSGTRTVFHQAAAPSGWVQDATITDHTIQVIGGAGGAVNGVNGYSGLFQNAWTSGGHALTVAELAVHNHVDSGHTHTQAAHHHSMLDSSSMLTSGSGFGNYTGGANQLGAQANTNDAVPAINSSTANIQNAGSGNAHTHTTTFNSLSVQMIMCAKS